jgi:sarcosine oxidase/L-pipecolate oxidase
VLSFLPHKGGATKVLENVQKVGFEEGVEVVTTEVFRQRFGGIFRNANFGDAEELLWDPHTGWLDAAGALKGTIQAAITNGVEYVSDVASNVIIKDGVCRGIETLDGRRYKRNKVLVSTEAETARLLVESFPSELDLHAGDRFAAAAILEGKVELTESQMEM